MAILGGGRLARLTSRGLPGWPNGRSVNTGRVTLRTHSKRAFSFEVYPREAVSDLDAVAAVYAYARALPADASAVATEASSANLQVGYVGHTEDMAARAAQHDAGEHFAGYGFDLVLILRIDEKPIRESIARDLCETFDPVLNDLLRGFEGSVAC